MCFKTLTFCSKPKSFPPFCCLSLLMLLPLMGFSQELTDSTDYYYERGVSFEFSSADSMEFYANKLLHIGKKGNRRADIKYHLLAGVMLEEASSYDSAIYHNQKALDLAVAGRDSVLMASAYNGLGVVYKDLGVFDKSLEYFLEMLPVTEKAGEHALTAMGYLNVGQVYFQLGKLAEAKEYSTKSIALGLKHSIPHIVSGGLLERANYRIMTGDLDGSFEDLKEAGDILRSRNDRDGLPSVLNSMGAIRFYKGDFRGAIDYYQLSKTEAEVSNDPVGIGTALQNIGEAYIYLKDYTRSRQYLEKSLDHFKRFGNKQFIVANYQYLFDLEQARGDAKAALRFFQLKDIYEDSILNERNLAAIADLEVKYETEKKERQVEALQSESELKSLKLEQSRSLVIFVALLALLLITALVTFSSRQRFKLRADLANERERAQKTRFLSVIDGEEKERKRIARELHDGLGQLLSTARLTVSSLDDEQENVKIQNSIQLIDSAVQEVRSISHNLMPNALVSVGLDAALRDLVRRVNEAGKLKVNFAPDVSLDLIESHAIALYRVLQELMNNALKYAEASEIDFEIKEAGDMCQLTIRDNGKGFDIAELEQSEGIGWANVQSRIELIGGTISVFSKLGEGTTVSIKISNGQTHQSATG